MRPLSKDWCSRTVNNRVVKLVKLTSIDHGDETTIDQAPTEGLIGEDLHAHLEQAADGHAAGIGGVVRLRAIGVSEDGDVVTSCTFSMDGGAPSEMDTTDETPGSVSGMLAQSWRHNETMMRAMTAGMAAMTQHLAVTIREQRQEIETLRRREAESYEITERLKSKEHERKMQLEEASQSTQFKREMFGSLLPYVNAAVAKLAGPQFVRPGMSDFELSSRSFISALKADTLEELVRSGKLSKAQHTALVTMLEQFNRTKTLTTEEAEEEQTGALDLVFQGLGLNKSGKTAA